MASRLGDLERVVWCAAGAVEAALGGMFAGVFISTGNGVEWVIAAVACMAAGVMTCTVECAASRNDGYRAASAHRLRRARRGE
jgi:hypothetical protein